MTTGSTLVTQVHQVLIEAGRVLAESIAYHQTLDDVTQLVVPALADWCVMDLLEEGRLVPVAARHRIPERSYLAWELRRRYPVHPGDRVGAPRVVRTGESELLPEIPEAALREVAHDEEHMELLRGLHLRSGIAVPLVARGERLGALTLISETPNHFTESVRPLIEELGRQCALAVDNARLNQELERRVEERTEEAERRARQARTMAAELSRAEERERRRLAEILHDHLQQLLVGSKMQLDVLANRIEDPALEGQVQKIMGLLDESIGASRNLTVELSPPILYQTGLAGVLEWLGHWMEDKHGLHVKVQVEAGVGTDNEEMRTLVFQAVRELLFNAAKHAGVSEARVVVRRPDKERLEIDVEDRGTGFDPEEPEWDRENSGGLGLRRVRERLEVLGGGLKVDSRPGHGTVVTLRVPWHDVAPTST